MVKDKSHKLFQTLRRKHCLEILRYIMKENPVRYGVLKQKFELSDSTLSRILGECSELLLVEKAFINVNKRQKEAYIITDNGKNVLNNFNNILVDINSWVPKA